MNASNESDWAHRGDCPGCQECDDPMIQPDAFAKMLALCSCCQCCRNPPCDGVEIGGMCDRFGCVHDEEPERKDGGDE